MKAFIMSKVSLCPHEMLTALGFPNDGIVDGLYVKDLTCSPTFPPSVLMKKWTCREMSCGMCPIVIKLEKCLFFTMITQTCGSVYNYDAVVSNSTVTLSPTFAFIQDVINVVTPWSHSCCESKSIHSSFFCEYSVDLILTITSQKFTFHFQCYCSLHFQCSCVHFVSNVTIDRLFHNPIMLSISFEHIIV